MSEISAGETNLNDFVGKSGRITRLEVPELMGIRLKAMGLFEGQYLELSRLGNPMIVKAAGGKIAIAREIAQGIFMQACH